MTLTWSRSIGICLVVACFLAGAPVFAQLITADILGTVTDSAGAVLPNAKVTVVNIATSDARTTQTTGTGDFVVNLLPPGQYTVTIEAPAFKKSVTSVTLVAGDRARVDSQLQVGESSQTVEVIATTPALQTDSSLMRDTVSAQSVQDLPLNGRNYVTLVETAPGAAAGPSNSILSGTRPDERRQTSAVVANGQNETFNNHLVDGMDNNEREQFSILYRPSIDSLEEVKIDTNAFPAEEGRAGGAVINLITKSGTNTLHGGVYEYFRNDQLNANDFFANSAGIGRAEFRQNQFGGSVGGHIIKNKTFFFGDIEILRLIQGKNTGLLAAPTAFEKANPGNFSDIGGPVVPASKLDPVAVKYLALFPAANIPGAPPTANYSGNVNNQYYSKTADVRIDHRFSDKDSMFGRFTYNPTTTVYPTLYPQVTARWPDRQSGQRHLSGQLNRRRPSIHARLHSHLQSDAGDGIEGWLHAVEHRHTFGESGHQPVRQIRNPRRRREQIRFGLVECQYQRLHRNGKLQYAGRLHVCADL